MRVDNEKELEMNECEKVASELIDEKEKVNFNFENWFNYILIVLVVIVIVISIRQKEKIMFEILFVLALLGILFSLFLALIFTMIIECSLEIKRKISLKKDKEYKLAKEVILNYERKVFEFNEKIFFKMKRDSYKNVLDEEVEKMRRISKLENYLKIERERNEEK